MLLLSRSGSATLNIADKICPQPEESQLEDMRLPLTLLVLIGLWGLLDSLILSAENGQVSLTVKFLDSLT